MPGRGSARGRHVPGHLPGWTLSSCGSICYPAPRTTCSPIVGSVGSGAACACPVSAYMQPFCMAQVRPQPWVRLINTSGSSGCCFRSCLGLQVSLYSVLNDWGCLAFVALGGLCCAESPGGGKIKKKLLRTYLRRWGGIHISSLVGCTC